MKKIIKTSLLCIAVTGLSACESMNVGNVDSAPPYATERTATYNDSLGVIRHEPPPVVQPAPAPQPCVCDYSAWENRVRELEQALAACREANKRVQSTYRDSLRK